MKYRKIYLNPKQKAFVESEKTVKAWVGGRGSGKTSGGLGVESYLSAYTMPRSRGLVGSDTFDRLNKFTIPGMEEAWNRLGLRKDTRRRKGHYVIGRRPPDAWPLPYSPPDEFDNVISFVWGSCIDLASFATKNPGRGGNFQYMDIDEAALIDKARLDKATLPALRGNYHKVARIVVPGKVPVSHGQIVQRNGQFIWEVPFKDNPRYRARRYYTTMPWLKSQRWVLDFEKDDRAFYMETTPYDNIDVLGPDYIEDLRKDLTDQVFRVEVMNERVEMIDGCFYPYFDDEKHVYMLRGGGSMYDPSAPLDVSFDFNAGFICCVVGQEVRGTFYIHDVLYVKGNLLVGDLVVKFAERYGNHIEKHVTLFGDQTGRSRNVVTNETAWSKVEKVFRAVDWTYNRPISANNPAHKEKHEMINTALREEDTALPPIRIFASRSKDLVISIQNTPMGAGFQKDKSNERKSSVVDEHATHLSDAFDYLYFGKYQDVWQRDADGSAFTPVFGL